MFVIYEILYWLFVLFNIPVLFVKGKWHKRFWMRFGFWPEEEVSGLKRNNIWVHAVSVGEILAVRQFVQRLREKFPEYNFIISTVTKTGYRLAKEKFPSDLVIYAPLDFGFSVSRYIALINPRLYIATETEVWPNLFRHLHKKGVPVVLVNGRISAQSFQNYHRFRFFFRKILSSVALFCMQSEVDAERLKNLDVTVDRVQIVGNMKFDGVDAATAVTPSQAGFSDDAEIIVAGSTHPGEEEIVLSSFLQLKDKHPNLRLVIAPRHVERVAQIKELIERKGVKVVLHSQRGNAAIDDAVLLVDTIGHLRGLYSLAKIVFVGKSLLGHGGQNILEPASFAKPIIVGLHMENFKDVMTLFLKRDGIIQVANAQQFHNQLGHLLENPQQAFQLGANAYDVVREYQGATDKTCELIAGLLKG